MIAVTYYTGVGRYAELCKRLAASCERFNQPLHIERHADLGEWKASLAYKPQVIMAALLNHRKPVLWLDVDCELLAPFPKPPEGTDFGVHNWCHDPDNALGQSPNPNDLAASGGVMYFDYTAAAIELLVRWIDALRKQPDQVDDQCLSAVFNTTRPPITPWWMSRRFNWMTGHWGEPPADAIVRHDYTSGQHRNA